MGIQTERGSPANWKSSPPLLVSNFPATLLLIGSEVAKTFGSNLSQEKRGQLSSSYQFDIRNNIWAIFLNFGQEDIILIYRDISWKVTTWVQLPILLHHQPLKWTTEHKIYIETSSVTKRHFTVQGQNSVYSSLLIYRFVITLSPTACCNHTFVLYEGERGEGWSHPRTFSAFAKLSQ